MQLSRNLVPRLLSQKICCLISFPANLATQSLVEECSVSKDLAALLSLSFFLYRHCLDFFFYFSLTHSLTRPLFLSLISSYYTTHSIKECDVSEVIASLEFFSIGWNYFYFLYLSFTHSLSLALFFFIKIHSINL